MQEMQLTRPFMTGACGRSLLQRARDEFRRLVVHPLIWLVEAAAACLLVADLVVVTLQVIYRYAVGAPLSWSEDMARILLLAVSFFGAASALARGDNIGVTFVLERLPQRLLRIVEAGGALAIAGVSLTFALNALGLGMATAGQTSGAGMPLNAFFIPGGVAGLCMTVFAVDRIFAMPRRDTAIAAAAIAVAVGLWLCGYSLIPDLMPDPVYWMLAAFVITLAAGVPIGYVLALAALAFFWADGNLPQIIFAQAMFRGIDNFVLLAIPFFILTGYLMEANGMSERLIGLLLRLVGRMRGGLNVAMVVSMVVFSGISGSKTADVAAVGSVLIPAARRARQDPGSAVALLAASAVMAETIPPCISLIILGYVANLSIGGLFVAGLAPAGMMALALIAVCIALGKRTRVDDPAIAPRGVSTAGMVGGAIVSLGLIVMVFVGFRAGFATATEISAFAALYAFLVGGAAFRELSLGTAARCLVQSASRSGLILFIVAASQALSYVLTLQQIPHALGEAMASLSQNEGAWAFMLLSIAILVVMGSILEGAAALIIFGPLLVPAAEHLGINPLHYGVVLVIAMGIGLFAPPLGVGLYSSCLIGNVTLKQTVRPMLGYLGLLLACLLVIAYVPWLSTALPRALLH